MRFFKGKNYIVTGASSGIGKSLALFLAKYGANVAISARGIEALNQVKNEIIQLGVKCYAESMDVSDEIACQQFIENAVSELGSIDGLINNAGVSMRGLFHETETQALEKIMNINFWGALYCTKAALPEILKTKGSIVAVSSVIGFKGLPGRTGYAASKFAMNGFFESLRLEYMNSGVHILVACPGFTQSEIRKKALNSKGEPQGETPLDESKLMHPDEVATQILKAITKRKRFLVQTTQGKLIFWINKFFPNTLDKIIRNQMEKEPGAPFVKF